MSTDVTDVVTPILYDADGNAIDTNKLTLSVNSVTISAKILNTKDVSLEFSTSGEPADGYVVTGIEYKPTSVRIKGESSVLNPINKITIPSEILDVTGATEDITTTVDISLYPPEGTSLVLNSDATISVTVHVEPIVSRSIEVPVSNITIENLDSKYTLKFNSDTFVVTLSGASGSLDKITASMITATVDAASLKGGEHSLPVNVTVDEDLYAAISAGNVEVIIEDKDTEPAKNNSSTGGGSSLSGGTSGSSGGSSSAGSSSGSSGGGSSEGSSASGSAGSGSTNGNNQDSDGSEE
jgi:YbbR domain-containing protein